MLGGGILRIRRFGPRLLCRQILIDLLSFHLRQPFGHAWHAGLDGRRHPLEFAVGCYGCARLHRRELHTLELGKLHRTLNIAIGKESSDRLCRSSAIEDAVVLLWLGLLLPAILESRRRHHLLAELQQTLPRLLHLKHTIARHIERHELSRVLLRCIQHGPVNLCHQPLAHLAGFGVLVASCLLYRLSYDGRCCHLRRLTWVCVGCGGCL